jgi:hypothetical protein
VASKSISVSPEAYQYIKGYADQNGMTLTEAASEVILERKLSVELNRKSIPNGANDAQHPRKLETHEVDKGMGYERKKDEVTGRDDPSALFAISKMGQDLGRDRS